MPTLKAISGDILKRIKYVGDRQMKTCNYDGKVNCKKCSIFSCEKCGKDMREVEALIDNDEEDME